MSELNIILCALVDRGPANCPSTVTQCVRCERDLWLSNDSPRGIYYCNQCFDLFMQETPGMIGITPEQREGLHGQGFTDEHIDWLIDRANALYSEGKLGAALDASRRHHPSNHNQQENQ